MAFSTARKLTTPSRAVASTVAAVYSRRALTVEARAVRATRHGHVSTPGVLKMETLKLDSTTMQSTQVLVKMMAAPITPFDVAAVAGFAGKAASLPAPCGSEGVGVVLEVGAGVKGLNKGDVVVATGGVVGTWSTHVIADGSAFSVLPKEFAKEVGTDAFPVETASVVAGAPVLAASLLKDVPRGSVLVQNNASSLVGQAVVQTAKAQGVKTVNIIAKQDEQDNVVHHLQGLGADIVVDEAFVGTLGFKKTLADVPAPKVGLDGVGGAAATAVARSLGNGATLIKYGSSSARGVTLPGSLFTTRALTVKGVSAQAALSGESKEARDSSVAAAAKLLRGGKDSSMHLLLAREPFLDFSHALKRAIAPGSSRTVVMVMPQ